MLLVVWDLVLVHLPHVGLVLNTVKIMFMANFVSFATEKYSQNTRPLLSRCQSHLIIYFIYACTLITVSVNTPVKQSDPNPIQPISTISDSQFGF